MILGLVEKHGPELGGFGGLTVYESTTFVALKGPDKVVSVGKEIKTSVQMLPNVGGGAKT